MPRVDLFHATGNTNDMSSLELKSRYHQVLIGEKDRSKTAWSTTFGVYRFKVMPFGLRNAGNFSAPDGQNMDDTFVPFVACLYKRLCAAIKSIQGPLSRWDSSSSICKSSAFELTVMHVTFVSDRWSSSVISSTTADNVKVIVELPVTLTPKQLISFLQTCSGFRRFILNFAKVTEPLSQLTKKKIGWIWGDEQAQKFQD